MFDIAFTATSPEMLDDGFSALRGRITLGNHSEQFLAALGTWDGATYQRQWIQAAQRLVAGEGCTGFFTSAFQFMWTMWREGDTVFVQERLLTTDNLLEPFDPADPYRQIGPRSADPDDEETPSEWRLHISDIAAFLARRGNVAS